MKHVVAATIPGCTADIPGKIQVIFYEPHTKRIMNDKKLGFLVTNN